MSGREHVLAWVAGLLLVVFAVTITPLTLARALPVRWLTTAAHPADSAVGLSADRGALFSRAESVRRSVDPARIGRSGVDDPQGLVELGFTKAEATHLDDVARMFGLAAILAVLSPLAAAGLILLAGVGRRLVVARAAAARAAGMGAVVTAVGIAVGALAFGPLFTAFHAVLFEPGTWVFPEGSKLIATFPERFWMMAGGAWVICSVGVLVVIWVSAVLLTEYAGRSSEAMHG